MARLSSIPENTLSPETEAALDPFRLKGRIAPVYLEIANSQPALNAYLGMENALKQSTLSLQEIEAIKLLASDINRCEHCLSVHDFKAGAAGLDTQQKASIRRGEPVGIDRIDAIVATVLAFFRQPGALTEQQLGRLRDAGLTDQEMVELALAVSTIFFTNVFNHINNTQSSLPAAPDVHPE